MRKERVGKMRLLLALCALLLARGAPAPWQLLRCPTDALPAATARRAAAAGDAALARACWTAAVTRGGGGAARALRGVQEAQLALLEAQAATAPPDAAFPATFWELMALMAKKSILTLPELDALAHRFDVYLLHGQLACLEEAGGGAAGAVRSLALALALRESPALRRLLARVALGRGQPRAALASATAARRGGGGGAREAPADAAAALLLQFQALALWARRGEAPSGNTSQLAAVHADSGGQVAVAAAGADFAEDAGPAPTAEQAEEVWEEVRELIGGRFRALGVALPPGDPLRQDAPPPFLALSPPGSASANSSSSSSSSAVAAAGDDSQRWLALATPAAAREWRARGYTVLRGVLPPAYLRALRLRHEALFYGGEGGGGSGVRVEPDAPQRRHMLWDEELSLYAGARLLPAVDAIVGARTSSTYTASIAYARGGDLKPHVDREANAVSLSVSLGLVGAEGGGEGPPWPLHVCPAGVAGAGAACAGVELAPGDGLLYGGPRHTHYREPLAGAEGSLHVVFGFRDMHQAHCNSQ